MKNPLFAAAFAGLTLAATISCDRSTDVVEQPVQSTEVSAQMKDISGSLTAANSYSINQSIAIPFSDVVLAYRNVGTAASPVWQLLPYTVYLSNGREIDYNFVFNNQQVQVTTSANFDQKTMTSDEANSYLNNQIFRIVLVPAAKSSSVNYKDYSSVVKAYNIVEPKG